VVIPKTIQICLDELQRAESEPGADETRLKLRASNSMTLLTLGSNWCVKNLLLKDDHVDPWMLNGSNAWLEKTAKANDPSFDG
jgi:hypothetical protein